MGVVVRWPWTGSNARTVTGTVLVALLCLMAGALGVGVAGPAAADQGESAARRVAAASITAGDSHTCALSPTGKVRCWGFGGDGRLGHDNATTIGDGQGSDPTIGQAGDVPVGGTAVAITAGADHTCALLTAGRVRCWGNNSEGELGQNNATSVGGGGAAPSIIGAGDVRLGGTAVAIAAGSYHTCALLTTGVVRCWGYGAFGQLGHDASVNIGDGQGPDPSVRDAGDVPLGGRAVAITAGYVHTCALLTTGSVRCWGGGGSGQLGHNDTANIGDGQGTDRSIRQAGDVPLGGSAVAITAGQYHTCALLAEGKVRCWGNGAFGQLGHDATDNIGDGQGADRSIKQAGDVPLGGTAVAIGAGEFHTCALLADGKVRCWGYGGSGQLGHDATANIGDGQGTDRSIKQAGDVPVGGSAVAITAGASHTCALLTTGRLRCWGTSADGELGHDNPYAVGAGGTTIKAAGDVPVVTPVRVRAIPRLVARVGPTRDRSAPYVYRVAGHLEGRFVPDRATCTGRVALTVRRGDHRLQRHSDSLDAHCRYRFRVRLSAHQLPGHRTVRLTFALRYRGSRNLTSAATVRHARAR